MILQEKGKDVATKVAIGNPVMGYTSPVTPLECETGEIYHHFDVPKKGQAKKWIIFHTLEDMDKGIKQY